MCGLCPLLCAGSRVVARDERDVERLGCFLPPFFMGEVLERSGGDGGAPLGGAVLSAFVGGAVVIRAPIPPSGYFPHKWRKDVYGFHTLYLWL